MRAAALGLLVCVVACGSSSHRASASPLASNSTASAARTGGQPTQLPLDTVDFSCRLPVVQPTSEGPSKSAFLALPGRGLIDAAGNGDYYDRVVGRWLPVIPGWVAPDGRRYAEINLGIEGTASVARVPTRIRVIDAATDATLLVVTMADAIDYGILDFAQTGVEVFQFGPGIGAPLPGVWNVNPDTGVVTKISDSYTPPTARWILDVSAGRIEHRDATGNLTTWFNRPWPAYSLGFIPFAGDSSLLVSVTWSDAGRIVGAELWLVRGPNDAVKLLSNISPPVYGPGGNTRGSPYWYMVREISDSTEPGRYYSDNIVDEHGIWLSAALSAQSGSGFVGDLFLVTPAGAILHVDNRPLFAAGNCA